MSVEIKRTDDPECPGRSIYSFAGRSFEEVQQAIENLSPPFAADVEAARFSIPHFDRRENLWLAYGAVHRRPRAERARTKDGGAT